MPVLDDLAKAVVGTFDAARQFLGSLTATTINAGRMVNIHFQRWPGLDSNPSGVEHADATKTVKFNYTVGTTVLTNQDIGPEGLVRVPLPPGKVGRLEIFGSVYEVRAINGLEAITTTRGHQRRLQMLGYELGTIDGDLGPLTDRSILNFQADHNPLDPDGIVGAQTRPELRNTVGE